MMNKTFDIKEKSLLTFDQLLLDMQLIGSQASCEGGWGYTPRYGGLIALVHL